jgi:hypothetical protein
MPQTNVVLLECQIENLEKLIVLARECGFARLLGAMVRDLDCAQQELAVRHHQGAGGG